VNRAYRTFPRVAQGRCIGLPKILMTNLCIYDLVYCIKRDCAPGHDVRAPTFGEVRSDQDATPGSLTLGVSVTRARDSSDM
jgi:hypothetical protein